MSQDEIKELDELNDYAHHHGYKSNFQYWCTKCKRNHARGKIYDLHKEFMGKEPHLVWKQQVNGKWRKVIATEEEKVEYLRKLDESLKNVDGGEDDEVFTIEDAKYLGFNTIDAYNKWSKKMMAMRLGLTVEEMDAKHRAAMEGLKKC